MKVFLLTLFKVLVLQVLGFIALGMTSFHLSLGYHILAYANPDVVQALGSVALLIAGLFYGVFTLYFFYHCFRLLRHLYWLLGQWPSKD